MLCLKDTCVPVCVSFSGDWCLVGIAMDLGFSGAALGLIWRDFKRFEGEYVVLEGSALDRRKASRGSANQNAAAPDGSACALRHAAARVLRYAEEPQNSKISHNSLLHSRSRDKLLQHTTNWRMANSPLDTGSYYVSRTPQAGHAFSCLCCLPLYLGIASRVCTFSHMRHVPCSRACRPRPCGAFHDCRLESQNTASL